MGSNQLLVVHSDPQAFFFFFGHLSGWSNLPFTVSDPVELHRVLEGLVLSLVQPRNASNTHLTQAGLLLPSKRKL